MTEPRPRYTLSAWRGRTELAAEIPAHHIGVLDTQTNRLLADGATRLEVRYGPKLPTGAHGEAVPGTLAAEYSEGSWTVPSDWHLAARFGVETEHDKRIDAIEARWATIPVLESPDPHRWRPAMSWNDWHPGPCMVCGHQAMDTWHDERRGKTVEIHPEEHRAQEIREAAWAIDRLRTTRQVREVIGHAYHREAEIRAKAQESREGTSNRPTTRRG